MGIDNKQYDPGNFDLPEEFHRQMGEGFDSPIVEYPLGTQISADSTFGTSYSGAEHPDANAEPASEER